MNEISTWNFYLAVVMLCSLSILDILKSNTSIIENSFPTILRKLLTRIQYSYCHIFHKRQIVAANRVEVCGIAFAKLLQNNIYQTIKQQNDFATVVRCTHKNSLTIN